MRIIDMGGDWFRDVVDLANEASDNFKKVCAERGLNERETMVRCFRECDLVFGVWPDASYPTGVAVALVKGLPVMRDALAKELTITVSQTAFRFRNAAEAEAACQVWGDDKKRAR
jgi:hypothetical protein